MEKRIFKNIKPPDASSFPFILFGNKCDLSNDIKISDEHINDYCREHNNMPYFATSAKEDINLEEAFNKVADMAFIRNTQNEESFVPKNFVKVAKNEPKKKKCC